MSEIYQLPDSNSGNNGNASFPFSIPIGFGGMGNNGFGFGNMPPMPKLEEKDFDVEDENKAE